MVSLDFLWCGVMHGQKEYKLMTKWLCLFEAVAIKTNIKLILLKQKKNNVSFDFNIVLTLLIAEQNCKMDFSDCTCTIIL